jgi:hypothetical protein
VQRDFDRRLLRWAYARRIRYRSQAKRPALRAVADRFTVRSTVLTSAQRRDWALMLLGENAARQIGPFGSAQPAAAEHA